MNKFTKIFLVICVLMIGIVGGGMLLLMHSATISPTITQTSVITPVQQETNPLAIATMKAKQYPGSSITIERQLPNGSNYYQYLTSYMSDGLKIYALLTVPMGEKPKNGWPVILFNHGYITPASYQTFPTVGQYASYYPVFSRTGYIVFKPDYRGNGNSQGDPQGAYYSNGYVIDDLNALASIKHYKDSDPQRIGVWAHSMGGNITLRDLVINTKDIKAAVIWGGVVGSYTDLFYNWQRNVSYQPGPTEFALRNSLRQKLVEKYGNPSQSSPFWNSIDPTYFLKDITSPIQLDVGGADEEVPVSFSTSLRDLLSKAGKTVEFYEYPGDNHNISNNFSVAMKHSLDFFNKYVKGGE